MTIIITVSYTHLDVYKRQVLGLPIPEITQERIGASAVILSCLLYTSWLLQIYPVPIGVRVAM